jgi:hypothetical protein
MKKKMFKRKVTQNVAISLGYSIFSKNHNAVPKVTQWVKNLPIWYLIFPVLNRI